MYILHPYNYIFFPPFLSFSLQRQNSLSLYVKHRVSLPGYKYNNTIWIMAKYINNTRKNSFTSIWEMNFCTIYILFWENWKSGKFPVFKLNYLFSVCHAHPNIILKNNKIQQCTCLNVTNDHYFLVMNICFWSRIHTLL